MRLGEEGDLRPQNPLRLSSLEADISGDSKIVTLYGEVSYARVAFEFDVKNLLRRNGAGDEARTRNFQLGKLTLYH